MHTRKKILNPTINFILLSLTIICVMFIWGIYFNLVHKNIPKKKTIPETTQEFIEKCSGLNFREECYMRLFKELGKVGDLSNSRAVLFALQKLDTQARSCHNLAHSIANSAVNKEPTKWKDLLKEVDPQECGSGFFHGVLEGHTNNDPSFKISGREIQNLCTGNSEYTNGSCVHIMGHLSLVESFGDVNQAIAICSQAKTEFEEQCFSGVFMENMTKQILTAHGMENNPNSLSPTPEPTAKLEALCQKYTGKKARACWGELGYRYAPTNDYDPQKSLTSCSKAKNEEWILNCFLHAAVGIVVSSNSENKAQTVCNPLGKKPLEYIQCLHYTLDALMQNSAEFANVALSICKNSIKKQECYEALGGILANYFKEPQISEICTKAPSEYLDTCTKHDTNTIYSPPIFLETPQL